MDLSHLEEKNPITPQIFRLIQKWISTLFKISNRGVKESPHEIRKGFFINQNSGTNFSQF